VDIIKGLGDFRKKSEGRQKRGQKESPIGRKRARSRDDKERRHDIHTNC